MLQVIVQSDGGRGKSTIAALIAQKLTEVGIPVIIVDSDTHNAVDLLRDPERLRLNTASIAGRETACGGKVGIRTQEISAPLRRGTPTSPQVEGDAFGVVRTCNWTHLNRDPGTGEERPHIVPLTEEAIKFTKHQLHKPTGVGENVFGPTYTGFGHVVIADGADDVLAFRLKPCTPDELNQHLRHVQAVFQVWKETL